MLTDDDRGALLRLARETIAAHLSGLPLPAPAPLPVLSLRAGVFVSLHNGFDLRGCIGHIEHDQPLSAAIPASAVAAATADPRFPPLTAPELAAISIELSILGRLEPLAEIHHIEIGQHGLLVEHGWRRGLLLPQVAVEWNWDAETFLARTCHKAGLPEDAWKSGASVWRFSAEVFGEQSP
jgi:AmmeMemoRadiSam system protein A